MTINLPFMYYSRSGSLPVSDFVSKSMLRQSSSSFSCSLIIIVLWVGILISAGITASLPYVRQKGFSPLLAIRE
ncbi:hypothetical protein Tco_0419295, partial [Tanacetum coccineum]